MLTQQIPACFNSEVLCNHSMFFCGPVIVQFSDREVYKCCVQCMFSFFHNVFETYFFFNVMLVVVFEALDFVLKHLSNVVEFRVPQYVYSFGYLHT